MTIIKVHRAACLRVEGGEFHLSPSNSPCVLPEQYKADPYYRMLLDSGKIEEVPVPSDKPEPKPGGFIEVDTRTFNTDAKFMRKKR